MSNALQSNFFHQCLFHLRGCVLQVRKRYSFFAPDTVQEQYQWVTDSGTNLKYPRRLYEHINPEKEKSLRCWNVSKESCLPSQNRWTVLQEIYLCRKFASRPHQNKPADKWMSKSIHAEEDFKDTPQTRLPILPGKARKKTDELFGRQIVVIF